MKRSLTCLSILFLCFGALSCSEPITCTDQQLQTCVPENEIAHLIAFSGEPTPECGLPPGFESGPQSTDNEAIRQWYETMVAEIPAMEQSWRQAGVDVAQRARCAFTIRHLARLRARAAMPDKSQVAALQQRDLAKYGHPDGPTFCWLVVKNCRSGKSGEAVYEAIIESAAQTNPAFQNKESQ